MLRPHSIRWSIFAFFAVPTALADGPDIVHHNLLSTTNWGAVAGVRAYSVGSETCNIGDADVDWINRGTPAHAWNIYRLHDGRLTQVGMSFARRFCCAIATSGCGMTCNGNSGDVLGVGCRDVSGASFAGSQTALSPRSSIDAFAGIFLDFPARTGDAIFRRLQAAETDLDPALNPGALYFLEGVYVGTDDAVAGNALNNAGHRRFTVAPGFMIQPTGVIEPELPAISTWRANGMGVGVPDPRVQDVIVDVPGEGRFHVASKVTELAPMRFLYDYAVFNLNSDRAAGSFAVHVAPNVLIENAGFHAPAYHSDEVYDNTPWEFDTPGGLRWSSTQTYGENPNANALRWGTMYNFWFESNRHPTLGSASLGLFKPHTPQSVSFNVQAPIADPPNRPGDFDGDGDIDLADLAVLLADFGCSVHPCTADIDGDGDTDLSDLAILLATFGT